MSAGASDHHNQLLGALTLIVLQLGIITALLAWLVLT